MENIDVKGYRLFIIYEYFAEPIQAFIFAKEMNSKSVIFIFPILICLFSSCRDQQATALTDFKNLQQSIHASWPQAPDHYLFIPSKDNLANQLGQALRWKVDLEHISASHLPPQLRPQRDSLIFICDQTIDQLTQQRIHRWQASRYDVGPTLQHLQASEPEQLPLALSQVPIYYEAAKINLDSADLNELNMAIRFNIATFRWLTNLEKAPEFRSIAYPAKLAVKDFVAYCNSMVFEYYDNERK